MSSPFETLRLTRRDDGIVWLTLARPEKLNAFSLQMADELLLAGQELVEDSQVRGVIVRGEGRSFCVGIDTAEFDGNLHEQDEPSTDQEDPTIERILKGQDCLTWLEEAPFPTVAAIHGHALGVGLQVALACDLRLVARDAKLGLLEQRWGLMPDGGGTQRLPRLVGPAKAKELIFTAVTIDGDEAERIGLANRVVDADALSDAVTALASELARQPPLPIQHVKEAVNRSHELSIRDGLRLEAEGQAACLRSSDFVEALRAAAEQRPSRFLGQ